MYTYHVGQYLPDWHPWESYKDFFVGNKETNGCREILAIEMPWIVHIFGEIESVIYSKSRITELDIEFEDVYMLIINHKNGTIGSLIVDVVACEPVRDLRIIGVTRVYNNKLIFFPLLGHHISVIDLDTLVEKSVEIPNYLNTNGYYCDIVTKENIFTIIPWNIKAGVYEFDVEKNEIYKNIKMSNLLGDIFENSEINKSITTYENEIIIADEYNFFHKDKIAVIFAIQDGIFDVINEKTPELLPDIEETVEIIRNTPWMLMIENKDINLAEKVSDAYYGDVAPIVQNFRNDKKPVMIQKVL